MREELINAYNKAISNYVNKAKRGYEFGLFTRLRHSFRKNPVLQLLERRLQESSNEGALFAVVEHLLATHSRFHHHSFNSYFIDELEKLKLKEVDWACFTPKAIKTYQGIVYRGTSQPPEKIFLNGFKELRSSTKIENYLKFCNSAIGISTSKDFDCAKSYALNNKRSHQNRYIYAINYRSDQGYDILETGKARGLSFSRWHRNRRSGFRKQEVNIKDSILKEDIVGAWGIGNDGLLSWQDNPGYFPDDMLRSGLNRRRGIRS